MRLQAKQECPARTWTGVGQSQEDHKCGHNKEKNRSGTLRELSAKFAGSALKSMGILCKNGLIEPGTRSVDGSKGHRGIDGPNRSCTRLQEPPRGERNTNAESEGSPHRGRLCVASEADHRLRRLVHQVGNALEVNWKVTILQETAREGFEAAKCPHRRDRKERGAGRQQRTPQARQRNRPELFSTSVKSIAMG